MLQKHNKTKTRVQRKNCVFPFKIHNSFIHSIFFLCFVSLFGGVVVIWHRQIFPCCWFISSLVLLLYFFFFKIISFFLICCVFFFIFRLRIWKYLWRLTRAPLYICMCSFFPFFHSQFTFFHWFFRSLFYVLKLFYDYYSVDMNIYWKIISMTHQFCWLIQKQKQNSGAETNIQRESNTYRSGATKQDRRMKKKKWIVLNSNGTTLFCAVDLCM